MSNHSLLLLAFVREVFESLVHEHRYTVVDEVVYIVQYVRVPKLDRIRYSPNEVRRDLLVLIYSNHNDWLEKAMKVEVGK